MNPYIKYVCFLPSTIFSRHASLTRQAFLITALYDSRSKKGKKPYAEQQVLCTHM